MRKQNLKLVVLSVLSLFLAIGAAQEEKLKLEITNGHSFHVLSVALSNERRKHHCAADGNFYIERKSSGRIIKCRSHYVIESKG